MLLSRLLRDIWRWQSILAIGWLILGLWQWMAGINVPAAWGEPKQEIVIQTRIFSIFGNPNIYALILLVQISMSSAFLKEASWGKRCFNGMILAISLFSLFLTYSRGAWLIAILLLSCELIDSRRSLAWLMLLLPFLPSIFSRFSSIKTWEYRWNLWRETWRIIAAFDDNVLFSDVYNGLAVHAHQFYLQLWLENGFWVLLIFLFCMIYLLRLPIKSNYSHGLHRSLESFLLMGLGESWQCSPILISYFCLIVFSLLILAQEEFD